jgi:TFIIF-interacting CTD phosphatase-like protein
MGSSSYKKNEIKPEEKTEESKEEIENLDVINIIVEKSQTDLFEEQKRKQEEEQRKKEEEEKKKEELKQSILQKIKEEEIIIKISLTNEDFSNYIIKYVEDFIQIFNSLQKKNAFISLIFEFNKKYFYTFDNKDYPEIPLKSSFFEILKYSSIIVVCLVFMSKDLDLHKKYCSKVKEPVEKFIYSLINIVGRNSLRTKVINTFIKNYKNKSKRGPIFCINDVIKLLFSSGKYVNAYKNLKNCLNQIIGNLETESTEDVMTKINESVLFFFNASSYVVGKNTEILYPPKEVTTNNTKNNKNKKTKSLNKVNTKKKEEEKKVEEKKGEEKPIITDPFITEPMTKDFCLVLDIDETISHTMRLNFGNYFLLRPGVIHLIKKLYHFFEIDIFTAAIKRYADNIVNKLDPNDEYINYRFYREHCIYEGTKSVKKLVRIGRELTKIIFVDNIKYNAKYNMDNLYHVSSWKDDVYDQEIVKLQDLLIDIIVNGTFKDDIRKGIAGKDDQVPPPENQKSD